MVTAKPCKEFPVAVLQVGIKLSMQPPRGVRANMLRGLGTDISDDNFLFETQMANDESKSKSDDENVDHGTATYCRMLYALVFYHACVLERRKFGGIGWNIPYDWMASDLKTGVLQLQLYLPHVYAEHPPSAKTVMSLSLFLSLFLLRLPHPLKVPLARLICSRHLSSIVSGQHRKLSPLPRRVLVSHAYLILHHGNVVSWRH